MKVLHFIPSLESVAGSYLSDYKVALLRSMADKADVTVFTYNAGKVALGKAVVKICPLSGLLFGAGRRGFRKALTDMCPDVVHIHACWNYAASILFDECVRRHVPTVITVDRKLEDWHISRHYWLCKLPKSVMYQRRMLKKAGVLHFITEQEQADFGHLGWLPGIRSAKPLNTRTVTIEPFNITGGVSVEEMSDRLLALYQKVADSAPFNRMTEDERRAEDRLISIGLIGKNLARITDDDITLLRSLDGNSWRRILIHAHDENVSENLYEGLRQVGMPIPALSADTIDRFVRDSAGRQKNAATDSKIAKLMSDTAMPEFERSVCVEFTELLLKIKYACAHRSDFVQLFNKLRFNDYDEDLVSEKISSIGLAKDAARLFKIMEERYGLGEGFMFTDPLDDKGTEKLRKKLFKSEIQ